MFRIEIGWFARMPPSSKISEGIAVHIMDCDVFIGVISAVSSRNPETFHIIKIGRASCRGRV